MSIYVGIDQSLRKTGLCVIEDDKPVILELIKPPLDLRGPERLAHIRTLLHNHLTPYVRRVAAAALEAQSLGSLGDIDQLGQLNGVVQVLLVDLGVTPYKVPPATLKKFVTGHGSASKDLMMRTSSKLWNYDFIQDDVCDAHGLARFAQECIEQRSTLRHQVEAVYGLLHKKKRKKSIKRVLPKTI